MADTATVIREVTKGVWTFSRPFSRFNLVPVGGRSTAVVLSGVGGGSSTSTTSTTKKAVWVLASTPLDGPTRAKLDELGEVKYIIGPDAVHSLFLGDYKTAYPSAKLIGVEEHLSKPHLSGHSFDGVYGKDPVGTKYGFEDEIKSCFFSGFVNKDVAFFHAASKTLIQADLLFNLPCTEQYSNSKSSGSVPLISSYLNPHTYLHRQFLWMTGKDKAAMTRDAQTVASWDFDRIIPCHGNVIETGGKQAWTDAYQWYLNPESSKTK